MIQTIFSANPSRYIPTSSTTTPRPRKQNILCTQQPPRSNAWGLFPSAPAAPKSDLLSYAGLSKFRLLFVQNASAIPTRFRAIRVFLPSNPTSFRAEILGKFRHGFVQTGTEIPTLFRAPAQAPVIMFSLVQWTFLINTTSCVWLRWKNHIDGLPDSLPAFGQVSCETARKKVGISVLLVLHETMSEMTPINYLHDSKSESCLWVSF